MSDYTHTVSLKVICFDTGIIIFDGLVFDAIYIYI